MVRNFPAFILYHHKTVTMYHVGALNNARVIVWGISTGVVGVELRTFGRRAGLDLFFRTLPANRNTLENSPYHPAPFPNTAPRCTNNAKINPLVRFRRRGVGVLIFGCKALPCGVHVSLRGQGLSALSQKPVTSSRESKHAFCSQRNTQKSKAPSFPGGFGPIARYRRVRRSGLISVWLYPTQRIITQHPTTGPARGRTHRRRSQRDHPEARP
jgi:hypothetical protein